MFIDYLETPIGTITIKASEQGVTRVVFVGEDERKKECCANNTTEECKIQLKEYFAGKRTVFNLPLDQQGTAFQRQVWASLEKIKFGKTVSYGDIAKMIDNPKAVRAVGAANGKNPIGIIVPCHRVIGSNKTLTGYAGGIERKAWLLEHEVVEGKC